MLSYETPNLDNIRFYEPDPSIESHVALMHDLLRAYCLGLIMCCALVIDTVAASHYWEEEDFSTSTFANRPMLPHTPPGEIMDLLNETLHKLLLAPDLHPDLQSALTTRIQFRQNLLYSMSIGISAPRESLDYWGVACECLDGISTTHSNGKVVKEAFSSKIQRRLASTTPPKPVVEVTFDKAVEKMIHLCRGSQEATRLISGGVQSAQNFKARLWAFSSRKPPPIAYSRLMLSAIISQDQGQIRLDTLLTSDLQDLVMPADSALDPENWTVEAPRNSNVPPDRRYLMATNMETFMEKMLSTEDVYMLLYHALCSNRCRTRRLLCRILNATYSIEPSMAMLDDRLRPLRTEGLENGLSFWARHERLRLTEWIIQLGFEQDLYLPDELAGMYLYLSTVARDRVHTLQPILEYLHPIVNRLKKRQRKHKPQNEQEAASIARVKKATRFAESLHHEALGIAEFAHALSDLYILLGYMRLLHIPARPFSDGALRYELRMKRFADPPPYDWFDETIRPFGPYASPTTAIAQIRDELLQRAKSALATADAEVQKLRNLGAEAARHEGAEEAWKKNVDALMESCKAAGGVLEKLGAEPERVEWKVDVPEPGKRINDWWVVPDLTH